MVEAMVAVVVISTSPQIVKSVHLQLLKDWVLMAEFSEDYLLRRFCQRNLDIGRKKPCFQIKIEITIVVLFHFRVGLGSL